VKNFKGTVSPTDIGYKWNGLFGFELLYSTLGEEPSYAFFLVALGSHFKYKITLLSGVEKPNVLTDQF
jgi:hypothetical protein